MGYKFGEPIKTVEEVHVLSKQRKAIYNKLWGRHMPASTFMHQQAIVLMRWIKEGMLIKLK